MTIEITMIDIVCRIIVAISFILGVVLLFYDRNKTAKWFKENSKDKRGGKE